MSFTDDLVEEVVSAHREIDRLGSIKFHPAWHDLDDAGRQRAFDEAITQRWLEAKVDPGGLSSTTRAVLARILGSR